MMMMMIDMVSQEVEMVVVTSFGFVNILTSLLLAMAVFFF